MTDSTPLKEADYIIVGGGLAGCTLASRLSRGNPSLSILLIEAGQDAKGHPLTSAPLASFGAHYSELDWAYSTVWPPLSFKDLNHYARLE